MALLDQLFGQQPQQDTGGLVQSILSQRFQPSPEDASAAMGQTLLNGRLVDPSQVMTARMAPAMDVATRLSQLQLQGAQTQGENLKNQMAQFQMPYMQNITQELYGNGTRNAPPVGFGGNGAVQGAGNIPQGGGLTPPGSPPSPATADPRIRRAELAAATGNKALSEALMAEYNADPNTIARKEQVTKEGGNAADVGKTLNVMSANLPVVMQRLKEMEDASGNASYGFGVNNEGTGFKQGMASQFGYDKNNAILQQRAAQGVLPELGPQLAQAGIRGNKFLETLASSASGLNLAASPEAKQVAIQGLREQYISNLKSTARQVRAMGGQAPSDAEIDAQVAQYAKDTGNTTGAPKQQIRSGWTPQEWEALTPEEKAQLQ